MAINLVEAAPLFDAAMMYLWTISSTLPRKRGRPRFSIESVLNYPFLILKARFHTFFEIPWQCSHLILKTLFETFKKMHLNHSLLRIFQYQICPYRQTSHISHERPSNLDVSISRISTTPNGDSLDFGWFEAT